MKSALLAFAAILALATSLGLDAVAQGKSHNNKPATQIQRVLLVSIDGMHAVDYLNCTQGVAGVNNGQPYCPHRPSCKLWDSILRACKAFSNRERRSCQESFQQASSCGFSREVERASQGARFFICDSCDV